MIPAALTRPEKPPSGPRPASPKRLQIAAPPFSCIFAAASACSVARNGRLAQWPQILLNAAKRNATRKGAPKNGAPQAVKPPQESAEGRKPFRTFIVPDGMYVGAGRFLRRKIPFPWAKIGKSGRGRESTGFCGFAKGGTAMAQIENLRGGPGGEDAPPSASLSKKYF